MFSLSVPRRLPERGNGKQNIQGAGSLSKEANVQEAKDAPGMAVQLPSIRL
jgi:hypothetical protein